MYERFSDRARKVMQLANQEAMGLNECYIGTHHILLALLKEGSGVGSKVLMNLGISRGKLRSEILKLVCRGPDLVNLGRLPQVPSVKRAIECAIEESRTLNHNYVGTEHLLLGLLRETESVAALLLMNEGLKLEQVREEINSLLGGTASQPAPPRPRNEIEDLPEPLRPTVAELDAEIRRFTVAKMEAVGNQDYELAARQRDEADKLQRKRKTLLNEWLANCVVDRSWLLANEGAALKLVRSVGEQRCWDLLPNLADALELAGCTDAELLEHCRQPGEHSNHCWVVDLLLAQA